MEDQRMMMGIRTPGGVGPFGGVSKDIQNEIFKGRGRAMSGMQYGQPGRASGGRTATGYPQRPSQGFQPSTNFGNPRASEGFGNGRGFGSFR